MFSELDVINLAKKVYEKTAEASIYRKFVKTAFGDDCFSFTKPENKISVVTTDMLVEGVHFDLSYFSYADVGFRSVAVNVSDLNSSGAEPAYIFLSLGIPEGISFSAIKELFYGIEEACLKWGCILAGGDTTRAKELTISITAHGFASRVMERWNGKPGQIVCASGILGKAYAGFVSLEKGLKGFKESKKAFLRPEPDVKLGAMLSSAGVSACEDISDGLFRDLKNICSASRCGAVIFAEKIPLSKDLPKLKEKGIIDDPLKEALSFGDDYELVFTTDKDVLEKLKGKGIVFYEIGFLNDSQKIELIRDGSAIEVKDGYIHTF